MSKNKVRMIIAIAVPVVLYHLLVFLIPFSKTTVFWISYVFTLASMAIMVASFNIAFRKGDDIKSKFYGFPIARIGFFYGVIQMAISLGAMALGILIPWWVILLVYAILMGGALLGLVGADIVRDEIEEQDARLKKAVSAMRTIQSKVNQLPAQCEDETVAAALKRFVEDVRYSDPVSNEALAEIEAKLSEVVDQLQQAVASDNAELILQLCKKATAVLMERNRLCKLNK